MTSFLSSLYILFPFYRFFLLPLPHCSCYLLISVSLMLPSRDFHYSLPPVSSVLRRCRLSGESRRVSAGLPPSLSEPHEDDPRPDGDLGQGAGRSASWRPGSRPPSETGSLGGRDWSGWSEGCSGLLWAAPDSSRQLSGPLPGRFSRRIVDGSQDSSRGSSGGHRCRYFFSN